MKNKIGKIIPYLFVLIMLVGFLGVTKPAQAQGRVDSNSGATQMQCYKSVDKGDFKLDTTKNSDTCKTDTSNPNIVYKWEGVNGTGQAVNANGQTPTPDKSAIEEAVAKLNCLSFTKFSPTGCLISFSFPLFFQLPAFILTVAAKIFNALLAITLSSQLYTAGTSGGTFIAVAWGIVRDMSNIFFILILLYTAIQVVLGLSHSTKKTISMVIVMAMLINFSMFFTQVIIDSSNVLALIFYNKITIKGPGGETIPYTGTTSSSVQEKDFGGAIAGSFNPSKLMTPEMFDKQIYKVPDPDYPNDPTKFKEITEPQSPIFLLAMIFISCIIFLYAAYAFFIAGISFIGRLIELWMLIIFSPFAFMSSTLHEFETMDSFGWKPWFKKLMSTAFMAPLFMFFMYLISQLIGIPMFTALIKGDQDSFGTIISVAIPAIINLTLLMKAVDLAKKGGGKFGELALKGVQMAGGLALGAATGGAAMLASNTVGRIARNDAGNDELKKRAVGGDKGAQRRLALSNSLAKNSFDFRQTGVGKFVTKKTGLDMDSGLGIVGMSTEKLKGGRKERDKEDSEKDEEKGKSYELSPSAARAQNDRAEKYNADKDKAAKNTSEAWDRDYEAKRLPNKFSANPVEEKTFEENYKKTNPKPVFNEEAFKQAYEKGDKATLQSFGIDIEKDAKDEARKKVQSTQGAAFNLATFEKEYKPDPNIIKSGSVGDAKSVNKERRDALAWSLENPDKQRTEDGKEIVKALKDYTNSITTGMAKMTMTPGGLATTATIGALTGGIGAAIAIPIGGLIYAIKDMAKDQVQARVSILAERKDVIAGIRKGVDKKTHLLHELSEMVNEEGGHGDHGKQEGGGNGKTHKTTPHTAETHETPKEEHPN